MNKASPKSVKINEPAEMKVVLLRIENLVHPAYNSRKINERDFDQLKKSITDFGSVAPAVVNKRNMVIVGGNQRVRAAKAIGWTQYPCLFVDLDEKRERELNVRLNRNAGEWDFEILAKEFTASELFSYGFTEVDNLDQHFLREENRKKGTTVVGENEKFLTDETPELPGVADLKPDLAFPSNQPYGIPELLSTKLADIPQPITTYIGPYETEECEHYIWIWHKDVIKRGLDFRKVIVGFYVDDYVFESTWVDPVSTTKKIMHRNPYAVIAPNFSMYGWQAQAVHIYNTYRARWVARYWQEAGIAVIPDINFCRLDSLDYTLAGIPVKAPALSIQLQTAEKNLYEFSVYQDAIKRVIKQLKPQSFLVYGSTSHYEEIFMPVCPKSLPSVFCESRVAKRMKFLKSKQPKSLSVAEDKHT